MKRELLKILRCPVCKGLLTARVEKETDNEIVSGTLHCAACNEYYPIVDGIPNLLPPEMR
ncbi:MAG TPA: methytransferase partner Trm112 [Candidatus Acidoferrales bacterium]|nr:methytransferase partner Trm112 [Candidatus Acidoferrales bacterium]